MKNMLELLMSNTTLHSSCDWSFVSVYNYDKRAYWMTTEFSSQDKNYINNLIGILWNIEWVRLMNPFGLMLINLKRVSVFGDASTWNTRLDNIVKSLLNCFPDVSFDDFMTISN